MKKIFNILFAILVFTSFAACAPQDDDDQSLGNPASESDLSFKAIPSTQKVNIIEFTNESKVAGVANWDFGNGSTALGEKVSSPFPYKGDYTIKMTLYTKGGATTISTVITIAEDDFSLINTPNYEALTGGASKPEGKTWVFDQYHSGHFGVGPTDLDFPMWFSAAPNAKAGSSLYTQEFTFFQDGTKLVWKNNGYIYTGEPGKDDLNAEYIKNPNGVGDFDVKYTPKDNYTFLLNEKDMILSISNNGFLGHYIKNSTYQVLKLTKDELYVKCMNKLEDNIWYYRFVPKDKNIKPIVPIRAVPLFENFESAKPAVTFVPQDMGPVFSQSYSNPWADPVNQSLKVCAYEKSTALYTNLSFTATTYKFDLAKQSKIKMKVYIPSKNDYTTEYAVDGPWVVNKKLLPQIAVKLQNSESSTPWEGQAEIVRPLAGVDAPLEKDKWIDLEFDFSSYHDENKLYNKIIIQFGAEGHAGPGRFFFDDFSFDK